ncbi:type I CRISPR-associated protein Cas7 [Clostridium perfringens]|uniref:type I CRISPR-associated protein Cas7 n=1 Tax=Clostridium perfringens TaxID=1502 RepID=UPI0013E2CF90|nr:type I CRISPR-associated protein Cas7 [Clostridium perfringens]MCX0368505.1 type I CRISPR-associated protein Cas7 [Clostridium perfringens]MCX0385287.1 type I CRISPR-associated protein Cas7 [Clostridium perfringens]MDT7932154.1 type I CRISPR-associated protein Cas7 [Clostridium perfringens]MDT7956039.1 type I CRISPR-associated protein Cas7 [Clostridium perfringens]NGT54137.1 type I CRISPR-associated protein Cas7 [Clostridium perfringens]
MDKRVYGLICISSRMANWNADFTGFPKTTSEGEIFGSDKALKYPMKKAWDNAGDKILYIKSMKFSDGKKGESSLVPKSLKERYESLFGGDLKEEKDGREVLKNLFKAKDVKNFGATFAEAGNNISITGAVQIGQGYNLYEEAEAEEQTILSPFRDGSEKPNKKDDEEAKNSTLGTKIVTPEAHYCYPFVINPLAYKEFIELEVTEGYTEEDYEAFKEAAISSATAFATNSKVGCENELSVFIKTDNTLYLPNLDKYVKFIKGEEKNTFELNFKEILDGLEERIESIEVYYNPLTINVKANFEGAKYYNIFSKKEV